MRNQKYSAVFSLVFLDSLSTHTACDPDGGSNCGEGKTCGVDHGAQCGEGEACGGDVVGRWELQDGCVSGNVLIHIPTLCREASVDATDVKATGTMTFENDKTYAANIRANGTIKMTMPPDCLHKDSPPLPCEQVGALLTALAPARESAAVVRQCAGRDMCLCKIELNHFQSERVGTYKLDGNRITLTDGDRAGQPKTSDYCADSSSLSMTQSAADGSKGGSRTRLTRGAQ